ncbi:SH3 domain-containing protein [Pseudonocardia spinosispora]|uniref:SH3 domain-containing protein n=1 Tax=Pseudonocardia spinosispora TaxID=103441 RepID=UPI000422FEC6|nr:SH3 domain-containing protein [Pseudonocardia spinosispora]
MQKIKLVRPKMRSWTFALGCALVLGVLVLIDNGSVRSDVVTAACRVEVTADVLNARDSPDAGGSVAKTLHKGDVLGAETTVQNGYRKLLEGGWALDDFLRPLPGSKCVAL